MLARVARNKRLADACEWWAFCPLTPSPGARRYYDLLRHGSRALSQVESPLFLAVKEAEFVHGEWHAGSDEDQFSAQPRLNIAFTDSVLHVAVLWRHDAEPGRSA